MKDELIDLLRERFSGHESEVPDGVWENVSGQLAVGANSEGLREALQDKFRAHEVEVDPGAWANISSQLGHGAAAGTSSGGAWLAVGMVALAVTAGILFWNNGQEVSATAQPHAPTQEQQEQVTSAQPTSDAAGIPEVVPMTKPVATEEKPAKKVAPAIPRAAQKATPTRENIPQTVEVTTTRPARNTVQPTTQDDGQAMGAPASRPDKPVVPLASHIQEQKQDVRGHQSNDPIPSAPTNTALEKPTVNDPDPMPTSAGESDASTVDPFAKDDAYDIFIPNVITANGDGLNDKLKIVAVDYSTAEVRIYSAKNGALIYSANDLGQMWDGLLPNGNIAEEGYYNCIVQLTDLQGKAHSKREVVRLFR